MGRFTIGMFSPLGSHSFKSEYKLGLQLATEKIIVIRRVLKGQGHIPSSNILKFFPHPLHRYIAQILHHFV